MIKAVLAAALVMITASCSSTSVERAPIYGASALAGATAYKFLEDKSPETQVLGSLAAAGGTYLLGDYIHGQVQEGKKEKYEEGFKAGQANASKNMYWIIQRMQSQQQKKGTEYLYKTYEFPGAEKKDGVNYLPHNVKLRVIEGVKK